MPDPDLLADAIASGDRRALAKGITLIESAKPAHAAAAEALVAALLRRARPSIRIGLSGTPGAGKSTFIEAFGLLLTARGHRVAVLAVDPSSRVSGGSILGDKTRMDRLSRDPNAFIRPSPSGGTLGGVARRTREAIVAVEAAGFDVVIVETVGVGQSETAVADMTDLFVLVHAPGGGDELQGVKRGIMELADLVVVNKADGDLAPAAARAASDLQAALHLMRPKHAAWTRPSSPSRRWKGGASTPPGPRSNGSAPPSAPRLSPSGAAPKPAPGSGPTCRPGCSKPCPPTRRSRRSRASSKPTSWPPA